MKITVLLGGTSAERDVSIVSGVRVADALRQRGHTVQAVDPAVGPITREAEEKLLREGVKTAPPTPGMLQRLSKDSKMTSVSSFENLKGSDVVFLALHGGQGEDGTVQALLEFMGIPYTGSGPMASAIAMDKDVSKQLMRGHGVPTPDWLMAPVNSSEVAAKIGLPAIVKPSKQGSTVGLSIVRELSELSRAIEEAYLYDDEVMVERFIPGRELTVGVLGDRALPVGEIFPKHEIYDYECKYTGGMAHEEFPASLSAEETTRIQKHAIDAFRALKLRGYSRIDFRMGKDGTFHCLEANTLPGLTALSLIPQAAAAEGMDFPSLCETIVHLALDRGSK